MTRRWPVLLLLLAGVLVPLPVLLVGVFVSPPAEALTPGWIVLCAYSHSARDDPIVAPGRLGGAHLHDFLGNASVGANSTFESMHDARTTCRTAGDTAGYWVPALYRNGVKVNPTGGRQKIYYVDNNLSAGVRVAPFPADMRLVTGNSAARRPSENPSLGTAIYWGCSDNSTGKLKAPPASCRTGVISLHVAFPNCWDGVRTHSNDSSHVVFPANGRCPSSHPRALPRLIMRLEYPVSRVTGRITLSSGNTSSAHGDFWNTWKQSALTRLTDRCLNANVNCKSNPD